MKLLLAQVQRLARCSRLLVACDFDGTLAPIVDDPARARPIDGVREVLAGLAALRQTDVAIVSGRSLSSLDAVFPAIPRVRRVGSHGAEWSDRRALNENEPDPDRKARLLHALSEVCERFPGSGIEDKPHGGAFHYRQVAPERRGEAEEAALAAASIIPGTKVLSGKMVVEVSLSMANKGLAVRQLRQASGASGVLYVGDDRTDEDAFGALGEADIGVSVGEERDGAHFRVSDPHEVLALLRALLGARQGWDAGSRQTPIDRHAVLSDQRTIALLSPEGSVVWMCAPRVDAQAVFARLLGPAMSGVPPIAYSAGEFSIGPADASAPTGQQYVGDSMIVRTSWREFALTDYLDCSGGRPFQRAGRTDLVRVLEGTGRVRVIFRPRPEFGRATATLSRREGGLVVHGAADPMVLYAPGVEWTIEAEGAQQSAIAEFELSADRPVMLELRVGGASLRDPALSEPARRGQTERFWSAWAGSLALPGVEAGLVKRSALTLKALIHGPTGAILAAGTTSLPEWPGGVRNWDYRFCWPRDACLAARALVRLGNTGQAMRLLDWLLGVVDRTGSPERMRPIYTVTGEELGAEADLTELSGYLTSRPVRIGNSAGRQVQLDIFGPVVDLVWELARAGAPISPEQWRLVEAMVLAVQRRWQEPDHGIWEIRGPQRHYVHSKVMCWVAIDRALRLSEWIRDEQREDWARLRAQIHADVIEHGWHAQTRRFTMAYDLRQPDAACLHVGLSGLLPPGDERFRATVESVRAALVEGNAVFRYRCDDGLPGAEGGFLICTGWLIESLLLIGEVDLARAWFKRLVESAGSLGLFAEQVDPHSGAALGNYPQAYSHLALVNAAIAIDRAGGAGA